MEVKYIMILASALIGLDEWKASSSYLELLSLCICMARQIVGTHRQFRTIIILLLEETVTADAQNVTASVPQSLVTATALAFVVHRREYAS